MSVGMGCGLIGHAQKSTSGDTDKDKTLTDRGVDVAVGNEKIGVPECDEVVDFLDREIRDADDDFVTKAVKKTALNQFKQQFKQAIEENKTDKVQLAKVCKDFKQNLEEFKEESERSEK